MSTGGKVAMNLSMSLDGFIAGPNDGPGAPLGDGGERLFAWYQAGDTAYTFPGTDMEFHIARASADMMRADHATYGAFVTGRRTFEIANAWGGKPPLGLPTFVVTNGDSPPEWTAPGSPFTFVSDGLASAIAQARAVAGDRNISVGAASLTQQALSLGLLDEVNIDLVPILLGGGVRLFDHLAATPISLEQVRVVETPDVTHLRFRVVKG